MCILSFVTSDKNTGPKSISVNIRYNRTHFPGTLVCRVRQVPLYYQTCLNVFVIKWSTRSIYNDKLGRSKRFFFIFHTSKRFFHISYEFRYFMERAHSRVTFLPLPVYSIALYNKNDSDFNDHDAELIIQIEQLNQHINSINQSLHQISHVIY